MSDSIVRLRVDSAEYDQKLKRASEQLNRYAEGCRKAGGTLEYVDEGVMEFTRSLGKMETTANSAKGKLGEMTKAFTDLSVQYKNLTDEEKKSPFGKALAKSLEELKGRINTSKTQIDEVNQSLNGSGGLGSTLDAIAGKFGVNIDQLTKFGGVLGATTLALNTAKDAFFENETNVDNWGRVVESSESVYRSFLQTLNTGDFSGFLTRIGEVINKATEAYNALDELGTRMSIINPERTRLQARATELKAIIKRQGADSAAGLSATNELRQIESMLTEAFKTESQLNMNAFKAKVDEKLAEAGIKLGKKDYAFLMRTFSSDASFQAMRRAAKGGTGSDYIAGGSYDEGSVYKYDTRNMNQKLLDLFTDKWRQENAALLNAAFSARGAAASSLLSNSRYLKESGSAGTGGSGNKTQNVINYASDSIAAQQAIVSELTKEWQNAGADVRDGYLVQLIAAENALKRMKNEAAMMRENLAGKLKGGEVQTNLGTLTDYRSIEFKGLNLNSSETQKGVDDLTKSLKEQQKAFGLASQAATSFGAALAGIEDPGVKAAGMVMQAVASIALGFATASANANTAGTGWGWLAWLAAGASAMATTIATIHSLTGYAEGGMVKGNSYSGDNIPIMANAGEVVLSAAQQNNVAQALEGGGMKNLKLEGVLKGENIWIAANRYTKRTGQGEIVTW